MKQESKQLVLKDLCARLPYSVFVNINGIKCILQPHDISDFIKYDIDIKPCLFPLSSMTEEQKKEYNRLKHEVPVCHYEYGDVVEEVELFDSPESFEYLIEKHFDYRGLIPMELAIDATGLNIY